MVRRGRDSTKDMRVTEVFRRHTTSIQREASLMTLRDRGEVDEVLEPRVEAATDASCQTGAFTLQHGSVTLTDTHELLHRKSLLWP